jgi:hypothetical protein
MTREFILLMFRAIMRKIVFCFQCLKFISFLAHCITAVIIYFSIRSSPCVDLVSIFFPPAGCFSLTYGSSFDDHHDGAFSFSFVAFVSLTHVQHSLLSHLKYHTHIFLHHLVYTHNVAKGTIHCLITARSPILW